MSASPQRTHPMALRPIRRRIDIRASAISTPSRAAVTEGVAMIGWVSPVSSGVVARIAGIAVQICIGALGVVVVLVPDVAEHRGAGIAAEEGGITHVGTGRMVHRHDLATGLGFGDHVGELVSPSRVRDIPNPLTVIVDPPVVLSHAGAVYMEGIVVGQCLVRKCHRAALLPVEPTVYIARIDAAAATIYRIHEQVGCDVSKLPDRL